MMLSRTRVGVLRSLAGVPWRSSEGADPISPCDGFPKRLTELLTLQLLIDLNIDRLCYSACGRMSTFIRPLTRSEIRTHRDEFLEADLLVLVGVSSDEDLDDLSHLVPRQGETCLSEQLLELEVAHIAAVINIWTHTGTHTHTYTVSHCLHKYQCEADELNIYR